MTDVRSWRESLTDWTDIDLLQHDLALRLGIVAPGSRLSEAKALYWTSNALGETLAQFVFALARAGILEAHPDDPTQLRWNADFTYPVTGERGG